MWSNSYRGTYVLPFKDPLKSREVVNDVISEQETGDGVLLFALCSLSFISRVNRLTSACAVKCRSSRNYAKKKRHSWFVVCSGCISTISVDSPDILGYFVSLRFFPPLLPVITTFHAQKVSLERAASVRPTFEENRRWISGRGPTFIRRGRISASHSLLKGI